MKVSLILCLIVIVCLYSAAALRRKQSKVDTNSAMKEDYGDDKSDGVETLTTKQLQEKMAKMKDAFKEDELSASERFQLEKEEADLAKKLMRATKAYGEDSQQRANALHALGGNLYRQQRFEEVIGTAKEIVAIHEKLDGPESKKTADALGNLAAVAFRVNDLVTCHHSMRRALFILKTIYPEESKEILLHRGKMLTFQVPHAEVDEGLSYEDYQFEL